MTTGRSRSTGTAHSWPCSSPASPSWTSDPSAALPAAHTFTAEDAGVHTFPATLHTPGTHSVTARPAGTGPAAGVQAEVVIHDGRVSVVPVRNGRDQLLDSARRILYVTTTLGVLERYHLATQTLLPPWRVGHALNGADVTPDGRFLYVAENTFSITQGSLHRVDLATGRVTDLIYDLNVAGSILEGGSWDVAIGPAGKGLVASGTSIPAV